MSEQFQTIQNHIVILGWSPRVPRIIRELRDDVHRHANEIRPILVVAAEYDEALTCPFEQVYFIYGRLNDPAVLRRANLDKAHTILIPTCLRHLEAADGEAVFTLLAALAVNPSVRVCVELAKAENAEALDQIRGTNLKNGDIEIVSFESVAEKLLAQAAINKGITRVYDHLLSFSETSNEIYVSGLDAKWHGASFRRLSAECFERTVLLIGYEHGGELVINPPDREYVFSPDDRVWYISFNKADGLRIINPVALA